ncbi:hypothetical protein tinsulaeT_17200 [Thalassotalea insulae]|uniref:Solute-binding protein family 3/N-terminal domain-containing protein n=1 Tax=Thalassotalea insulae TaxID=2056778 RepID=A0ABQ6GUN8_9GAMM|nr:transporter substrate-binding domain-containing protein [Thalassotalea insulae]GLX78380.1 hypothetical protein tinsulaeT_17200 [Thalassotalea insulae]
MNFFIKLALVILIPSFITQADETKLKLASDEWCPFICIQGKQISHGFLVDASKDILKHANVNLTSLLLPLNRAMILAEQGKIDGIYAPTISDRFINSMPLTYSRACFFVNRQNKWRYTDIKDLSPVTVNVVDDYGYDGGPFDAFLSNAKKSKAANIIFRTGDIAAKTNVQLLLKQRIEILLEHEAVMSHLLTERNETHQIRKAGCLKHALPLVIGISNSHPNAKELIQTFNVGLTKLIESGRFTQLMETYHLTANQF